MTLEKVVSMESIKEKLKDLKRYMPEQPPIVYDFGAFLADRLNSDLVAAGFVLATELALNDMEAGVDGFTGKRISGRLSGYPSQIYAILRAMQLPEIVRAVCPEDFAKDVEEAYRQINEKLDQ